MEKVTGNIFQRTLNRLSSFGAKNTMIDPIGAFDTSTQNQNKPSVKNVNTLMSKFQLQRIRQDIAKWRDAITEAEQAWYPHRVKMQQMFNDTVLNGHVDACMNKRKNLTLLKDFGMYSGEKIDDKATELLNKEWFYTLMSYCLDARFYGYSLIGLGSLENDSFPNMQMVKRWHVSPDRLNVVRYPNMIHGVQFDQGSVSDEDLNEDGMSLYDWTIYVSTSNETGASICGYGLLYKIAVYEIYLRNTMGYNADFVEMFGMPYRHGKTNKTEEAERAAFEQTIADMGSAGWAVTDPTEEIEFITSPQSGTGYKSYESFEKRCEAKISKIVLGHADALDSTPGKLGANTAVEDAIKEVTSTDTRFMETIINNQIIPKLKNIGIPIPDGTVFKFKNDDEKEEFRAREDVSNQRVATIVKTFKDAGIDVDPKYVEDRTGIKVTKAEVVATPAKVPFSDRIKNKLDKLYE